MSTENKAKKRDSTGVLPPLVSLKCYLSNEYLQSPVTLPCLHSFSRSYLEKYNREKMLENKKQVTQIKEFDEFANDFKSNELKEEESIEGTILTVQCPYCIEVLQLEPTQEPQVPFDNLRLARIIDMVKESRVLCQNCEQVQSEFLCKTCDAWLCSNCWEITHSAKIFKSHIREGLSHSEMFALPKCEQHPNNELEFFSTEDEVGVCQVCLLKGDFVGKPYCMVSDVRQMRQAEIEKGVRSVIEEKEKLLIGKQKMEQAKDMIREQLKAQKQKVVQNFADIRKALNRREDETLGALEELANAKTDMLKGQVGHLEKVLQVINDGARNVKLILTHSNDLELVYLTIVLQEFVADMRQMSTPSFIGEEAKSLSYFYKPVVNADLPVILSERVVDLVSAYASVPKPSGFPSINGTNETAITKIDINNGELKENQKQLLKDVGIQDESGCEIM